ncbi:uncharacterized protein LOC133181418 [Saccostrea echinata]|uniref:uncharacterized protein LOC133181418 n=1 Tax=Saccostrea echinata TaxID=191078 RepID=UPI002A82F1BA|nr:uncharacterized protein LOC133181418 [Saccostrea echinata]
MSGNIDADILDREDEGEPLQVEINQNKTKAESEVHLDCVENLTIKASVDKEAGTINKNEKVSFLSLDFNSLKSCCVLLCRRKCPGCVKYCQYIKLTISLSVNVVLVALIVFVVFRNEIDDSSNNSSHISLSQANKFGQGCRIRKDSVCVSCQTEQKRYRLSGYHLSGSSQICCKENSESLKILAGLLISEKRRKKTEDYVFLYFPSFPRNGDSSHLRDESLKTEIKSEQIQMFPGNKVIVKKSGAYVIFLAVTKTSIRHGNVNISIHRYGVEEQVILSASIESKNGQLTYDTKQISDVFYLQSGDSITIKMRGQQTLYTFKQSNYFGMYRIDSVVNSIFQTES